MSRYLKIEGEEPIEIASNGGWSRFIEWVQTLDDYPALTQFVEHGTADDIGAAKSDLDQALAEEEIDENMEEIAETLAESLDGISPNSFALITDGSEDEASVSVVEAVELINEKLVD